MFELLQQLTGHFYAKLLKQNLIKNKVYIEVLLYINPDLITYSVFQLEHRLYFVISSLMNLFLALNLNNHVFGFKHWSPVFINDTFPFKTLSFRTVWTKLDPSRVKIDWKVEYKVNMRRKSVDKRETYFNASIASSLRSSKSYDKGGVISIETTVR